MTREQIRKQIADLYIKHNIRSLPIDCIDIMKQNDLQLFTYEQLLEKNPELYQISNDFSSEAFQYGKIICYNTDKPESRVRFSLMHEFGHIILNHKAGEGEAIEQDANYFASNILAPRVAIHYTGCKNAADVARIFMLSNEAAMYAFDDYRRWRRETGQQMPACDYMLYQHFYDMDKRQFIYHYSTCSYCMKPLYNHEDCYCHLYRPGFLRDDLLIAEDSWLYGSDL